MKKYILSTFCILFSCFVMAQERFSARYNINADTINVGQYQTSSIDSNGYQVALIPMGFGVSEGKAMAIYKTLNNANVAKVELVYTSYPEEMDMYELNDKRLRFLFYQCPNIFRNAITKWQLIKQTDCKNVIDARKYFHGFVVYYKKGASAKDAGDELATMEAVISGKAKLTDSSVLNILNRKNFQSEALVADFTGSMASYVTQVIVWLNLKMESSKFKSVTFFNDGDSKSDYAKRIGKTGGIYYTDIQNKDTVLALAKLCTKNGYGGDIEENGLEAILYAIEKNPNLNEVVFLADNWAPMRDISLLHKIKIPVRVIICGKLNGIGLNPDLMEIALKTKGSLHTMEQDLDLSIKMNEGKVIEFDGEKFRIVGGKFYSVKE